VHVSRVLSRTLAALRDHVLEDVALPAAWERDRQREADQRERVMAGSDTEFPRPRRAS
jgi:hypothetical protein